MVQFIAMFWFIFLMSKRISRHIGKLSCWHVDRTVWPAYFDNMSAKHLPKSCHHLDMSCWPIIWEVLATQRDAEIFNQAKLEAIKLEDDERCQTRRHGTRHHQVHCFWTQHLPPKTHAPKLSMPSPINAKMEVTIPALIKPAPPDTAEHKNP